MTKYNLGAGKHPISGYVNLDADTGDCIHPLAVDAGSADEIRASHVLEHFSHREIGTVLADWVRALRPGGTLKIAVPDFKLVAESYLAGQDLPVQGYVMGGQVDARDFHKCIFDLETLAEAMRAAGLIDIRPWKSEVNDCAALPISLNLAGTKAGAGLPLKIRCVMSVPRLGFQDNFVNLIEGIAQLGIPFQTVQGAFWGQCLTRGLEDALADGCDAVLTVDFDSVFARDDVRALARLMAENPEADAIIPVQASRSMPLPMVTFADDAGNLRSEVGSDELAADLVRCRTGHFGLTLIRASSLAKLPRPWFVGHPDPNQSWHEGRIDDDIHFWMQMAAAGQRAFLAPRVTIGHLELMIRWPDKRFEVFHQLTGDYRKNGRPEQVWD